MELREVVIRRGGGCGFYKGQLKWGRGISHIEG